MKIGLGFYREQLTTDNFRFAVQAGATHVVAHLTNYFSGRDPKIYGGDPAAGWGDCSTDTLWTYDELSSLVATLRENELELAALKNFTPRFWSGRVGYIHFRNVRGKVPNYVETFVDDGDIDMAEIVRILRDENYQGVMIPDHTPEMTCDASWHAGKAFALGYMRALVQNADALGPARSLAAE